MPGRGGGGRVTAILTISHVRGDNFSAPHSLIFLNVDPVFHIIGLWRFLGVDTTVFFLFFFTLFVLPLPGSSLAYWKRKKKCCECYCALPFNLYDKKKKFCVEAMQENVKTNKSYCVWSYDNSLPALDSWSDGGSRNLFCSASSEHFTVNTSANSNYFLFQRILWRATVQGNSNC